MNITQIVTLALTLSGFIGSATVLAQEHGMHSGHDMKAMSDEPKVMDHSGHDMPAMKGPIKEMDHGSMNGNIQPQGGEAPQGSRDPHAYANGYTLTKGPYAQPGPRQLKLADEHAFWAVLGDRLEYDVDSESTVFDLQSWYGTTFNRLVIKAEGDVVDGSLEELQTDILYSQAFNAYFDAQIGMRLDKNEDGTDRQWLAISVQGLAPYWFEVDISAYLGEDARTALAIEAEYELLITQRLVLQSRAGLTAYGKKDLNNRIGSGLSHSETGIRLRYEISRQFAPYVGIEWHRDLAETGDIIKSAGGKNEDTQYIAGLRFWF